MSLILVAHGTRNAEGVGMIGDLAERVGELLHEAVRVAFVDVLGPTPSEVLAAMANSGEPAIVVPAFLSRGYHVHTDLPAQIAASGHPNVTVTAALGPGPEVTAAVAARLAETGWGSGGSVVLAATGTSNPVAQEDLHRTARSLSLLIGSPVQLAFAASGTPTVADAVAALRSRGARRVAVASYLLADGLFQQRLLGSGADCVAAPLGTHPYVSRLIAERFRRASRPAASTLLGNRQKQRRVLHRADRVDSCRYHQ